MKEVFLQHFFTTSVGEAPIARYLGGGDSEVNRAVIVANMKAPAFELNNTPRAHTNLGSTNVLEYVA